MGDLTLEQVVLRIAAFVLIAGVHGGAVAAMAVALGDRGPRYDERFTANPIRHIDLLGGVLVVLFGYGWLRPVAIDPAPLRGGRASLLLVVAAASGATIALAEVARLIRPFVLNLIPDTASATFFVFVSTLEQLCVMLTLINLLPLPPLTGQHLLSAVWPGAREPIRRSQPFAAVVLALVIILGLAGRLLTPLAVTIAQMLLLD